jgi:hypothetical protein
VGQAGAGLCGCRVLLQCRGWRTLVVLHTASGLRRQGGAWVLFIAHSLIAQHAIPRAQRARVPPHRPAGTQVAHASAIGMQCTPSGPPRLPQCAGHCVWGPGSLRWAHSAMRPCAGAAC